MHKVWKELHVHPIIARWFTRRYGDPTDIQVKTWVSVQRGEHVLLTAPTGSGKTLAAFLWSLNQLLTGSWTGKTIRVLYISPLKALNNDIRLNLLEPLRELTARFESEGVSVPSVSVLTRSGDTPQAERQRMLRHPPEILITTPESLNLILSSKRASVLLTNLAVCILDEIHAVAGNKRGTHLITAVERIAAASGEFQRIALSASVRPLQKVADFVAGYTLDGHKRKTAIHTSSMRKRYRISVCHPPGVQAAVPDHESADSWWSPFIQRFTEILSAHESTLFFANSRRLTEKITLFINEYAGCQAAYSHHGSLSREIRAFVESKLKNGELKAIVATSSLELGIDVGALDRIILIQTPFAVSSALQRIGRGGHRVNEESVGEIYPLHGTDFPAAAVTARAVVEQNIEEIHIPEAPMDILAQVIISMTAHEPVKKQDLYRVITTSYPYRNLTEGQFERILEMLSGKYADSRIRELNPRVSYDKLDSTIQAKPGALTTLYMSGGTIPDRGYFDLRVQGSGSRIGQLDEEFVWERSVGDTFTLGNQSWKVTGIDHQNVEVVPASGSEALSPFWKAENTGRGFHLAEMISRFLGEMDSRLGDETLSEELMRDYYMDRSAAEELIAYLGRQKNHTGTSLPGRYHLLIEHFNDPFNTADSSQVILHTLWGEKINAPFAIALSQAWQDNHDFRLPVFYDDDCIMVNLPQSFETDTILSMVTASNLEVLLRKRLESSGFFGARFRENAARALLLPKTSFNRRMPLWLNRLRAKKLLQAVSKYEDFPIVAETWRTCLQDEFDIIHLKQLLDELAEGTITISETITRSPSPFTANIIWRQTDQYMYEDDTPKGDIRSNLREDIFKEVVFSSDLRPTLPVALVAAFQAKLQRTYPGYAPTSGRELLDWVKERLFIPRTEWEELMTSIDEAAPEGSLSYRNEINEKITEFFLSPSSAAGIAAKEISGRLLSLQDPEGDPAEQSAVLSEWLRFYGPLPSAYILKVFGIAPDRLESLLQLLRENGEIIIDCLTEGSSDLQVCDAQNLEFLLRLKRKSDRPEFKPLPLSHLPLFCALVQGPAQPGNSMENLQERLEQLMGYPIRASLWESDILPARLNPYYCSWLDTLYTESDLLWFGTGKESISFCFSSDTDLFLRDRVLPEETRKLFADPRGRYTFWDMKERSGLESDSLSSLLWKNVWKGLISNDSYVTLRRGAASKFKAAKLNQDGRQERRSGFNRWKNSKPLTGNWFVLHTDESDDLLEAAEVKKERVRQLLQRYGIVFRELLFRETDLLSWKALFRTLRLMELSGEVLSGYFFKDIPGPQFMSHQAFRRLNRGLPEDPIYWMNAMDPASLCGIDLEQFKGVLPRRLPSNHLVYHGTRLVLVSEKLGSRLRIMVPPEDEHIEQYVSFFRTLVTRDAHPVKSVKIRTINDVDVDKSPYAPRIESAGFTRDYKALVLRQHY